MIRDAYRALWPELSEPGPMPELTGNQSGSVVVLEHARDHLSRQAATVDSLDAKAATIIGAMLVILGLVLPDTRVTTTWQAISLAGLLVFAAFALLESVAAYSVQGFRAGATPFSVTRALNYSQPDACAAVAVAILKCAAQNGPIIRRKGEFVQRGLMALAMSFVPLIVLFLVGGLG